MIVIELMEDVEKAVADELVRANNEWPPFRSEHEGYAVIKEEYEETVEELDLVKHHLQGMWMSIRQNRDDSAKEHVECMRDKAIRTAAEAIQVAAMCDKYMQYAEKEEPKSNLARMYRVQSKAYGDAVISRSDDGKDKD